MTIHSEKLDDVTISEDIFCSMTTKFNYIVYLIEESKDTDEFLIDELQSSFVIHEHKMK